MAGIIALMVPFDTVYLYACINTCHLVSFKKSFGIGSLPVPSKRQQPTAAERHAAEVEGLRRREIIGKALETWRVQHDVTQEAVAARAGCTTKTWGRLEAGEAKTRRIYYIAERVAGWPPGSIETYLASGREADLAFLTRPKPKDDTPNAERLAEMERKFELLSSQVEELVDVVGVLRRQQTP